MIEYYVAEQSFDENGDRTVIGKEKITEDEINSFLSKFDFMGNINPTRRSYEIAVRNAREYQFYMDHSNLKKQVLDLKTPPEIMGTEINRLIFNFCVSAHSFIDYAQKSAGTIGEAEKKHFIKHTNYLFDNCFSYRFFCKLRNFCAHYSFPITQITSSVPGVVQVTSGKEHLLSYDGWGAIVKKDLEKMESEINILEYVDPFLEALTELLMLIFYYHTPSYLESLHAYIDLQKKYQVTTPIFIGFDGKQPLELKPIPIDSVVDDLPLLGNNPYQNAIVSHDGKKLKYRIIPK